MQIIQLAGSGEPRPKKRKMQRREDKIKKLTSDFDNGHLNKVGRPPYSLRQKLEIVAYAPEHTEAEASRYYGVSRSTIYGWRNIDKEPIQKVPIVKTFEERGWSTYQLHTRSRRRVVYMGAKAARPPNTSEKAGHSTQGYSTYCPRPPKF